MKYRIKKVKLGKGIYLEWEEKNGNANNAWDKCSLHSKEQARPEFYNAVYSMRRHVVQICEMPEAVFKKIDIKSVTITHKDEERGIVISATKELEHTGAPLCLNTPHKSEADEGDYAMGKALIDDMNALIEEAARYINGDRAQGSLKLHEDDEFDAEEEDADDMDAFDGIDPDEPDEYGYDEDDMNPDAA